MRISMALFINVFWVSLLGAQNVNISAEITAPSCAGFKNGIIELFVTDGQPPYQYKWDTGSNKANLFGIGSGDYEVTVTDANGDSNTKRFSVTDPMPLEVTIQVNTDFCSPSVQEYEAIVTGGTMPYRYEWSNGQTSSTLQTDQAGDYFLMVTDANGCGTNAYVKVPEPFSVEVVTTPTYCADFCDASARAAITGGTAPYTFLWNTGQTEQILESLEAGEYCVTVTDANGCIFEACGEATAPPAININIELDGTCDTSNVSAEVSISGGIEPYTIRLNGTRINDTNPFTITDLVAGQTYTINVTDANGCPKVRQITIPENPELVIEINKKDISCGTDTGGEASVDVLSGTAPYTYQWSNGATTATITDLDAGEYTVTVTDAEGCKGEKTVKINFLDGLNLELSAVDVTCANDENGRVNVVPSGGTEPYIYEWINTQTSEIVGTVGTIQNLSSGEYSVTVKDILGCEATGTVTVGIKNELALSAQLNESDNSATIIVEGGDEPYTYQWSHDAALNEPTATDLTPGVDYTVTVIDANGCPATITFMFPSGTPLNVNVATSNTCIGEANGAATVSISDGTEPYTIEWSNGETGNEIDDLEAGDYSVKVTDALGNTRTINFTIDAIELNLDFTTTPQGCIEGDGTATVDVEGGTAPYTYNWSNGVTTQTIEALTFGTYQVTVTDNNGCSISGEVNIEKKQITLEISKEDANCTDENSGQATVVASGGTAPYTYNWNNGAATATIENVSAGFYEVIVLDADGCEEAAFITIEQDENITVETNSTPTGCTTDDGTATVIPQNGNAPYTYVWSTGDNTATVEGLGFGTYGVTVVDANGCSGEGEITVERTLISLDVNITNAGCEGEATGSATVLPTGGNEPYTYAWSNGATTQTIENLQPGFYEITVIDNKGCEEAAFANIEKESITLSTTSENISCSGGTLGSAAITGIEGGLAPYTYEWSNGIEGDSVITDLEVGTYTVIVKDSFGCSAEANFTITQDSDVEINTTVTNTICEQENGTALAIPTTGTAPFTYEWSNGSTQSIITGTAAGTYSVTITDDVGCQGEATVTIETENPLSVTATPTNASCEGVDNGNAFLTVEGATGELSYEWSNNETSANIENLAPGDYNWTVTDSNGCTQDGIVSIGQDEAIDVNIEVSEACSGQPVNIFIENNEANDTLNYVWTPSNLFQVGTDTTATPVFIGTEDVEVSVLITNQIGCTETQSVSIEFSENTSPDVSNITYEESCLGLIVNFNATAAIEGYTWDFGDATTTADTANVLNPTYTYPEIGTYTVTLFPSENSVCASPATFEVEVTGSEPLTFEVDGNTTICGDSTTTLSVNDAALTSTKWFLGETLVDSTQSFTAEAGEYKVIIQNEEGCMGEKTVIVEDRSINIAFEENYAACVGDPTQLILENLNEEDILIFDWQTESSNAEISNSSDENPIVTISETTTFSATITNQFGCSFSKDIVVEAGEVPTIDDVISSKDTINLGESVDLDITGAGGDYLYEWTEGGNTLDDITDPNPKATPNVEGINEYVVKITSLDGCEIEDRVAVIVLDLPCEEPYIYVPNVFTPNNDGINDVLYVRGFNIDEMHFVVYNRWGEIVFETRDKSKGWDGRFNGSIAEGRVFGYILEVRCTGGQQKVFKGNVTLLR